MTSRTVAVRYARALFDVLLAERADVDRGGSELSEFARLVDSHDSLTRAFHNPAVPASAKRAVIEELLARTEGLLSPVAKLLLMLAERDRLVLLDAIVEQYGERLLTHHKVVRAEVVTAIPLPSDRASALQAALARATGRDVRLDTRIDDSILGGAVARVGSTVYDGSLTGQLERMKNTLARQI